MKKNQVETMTCVFSIQLRRAVQSCIYSTMIDRICPPLFLMLVVVLGLSACRSSPFIPEEAPLIRFDQTGCLAECDPKAVDRAVRSQSTGTRFAKLEIQEPADGAVFPPEIAPALFLC